MGAPLPGIRHAGVVLATHLPGEGIVESRHPTLAVECSGEHDYWIALASLWEGEQTILNVERDIECSDAHIGALLDCPQPLCSWAYRCHWASTHLDHDVLAAGNGERDRDHNPEPGCLQGGEEWAAWSAIGLVKIAPEARMASLRPEPWPTLELSVHDAVARPWHMHGNASDGWQTDLPDVIHHHW